jgi:1D-myo-inositol-tetrakisphosphate 5-kinase/inositol-polyphosphate multikinase
MASSQHLVKFENQVAGHDNLLQLSTNDLMVLKPSTQQEREFYESCQQHEDFMEWIPECYGTLHAATDSEKQLLNDGQDVTTLQAEAVTNNDNSAPTNLPADRDDILLYYCWLMNS